MSRKGIKDLMEQHRFHAKHIAKAMIDNEVPGNWDSLQNIYNLVSGSICPKDPYVYVVLSNLFNLDISQIIIRYSDKRSVSLSTSTESEKAEAKFIW